MRESAQRPGYGLRFMRANRKQPGIDAGPFC
jgi:hypothetical protein